MTEFDLIIVRHAEAVDSSYFTSDSERQLTPRGERDASGVGRVRRMLNLPLPNLVFTSGYERAEQTLERVFEGQVVSVIRDLSFSPEGSVESAWRLVCAEVANRPAENHTVVWIFGHNPNIERLISFLSPEVGSVLKPYRKASLAWLRVSPKSEMRPSVQLKAYIPRPADNREKTAQLDL